jgi:hypothetical protein
MNVDDGTGAAAAAKAEEILAAAKATADAAAAEAAAAEAAAAKDTSDAAKPAPRKETPSERKQRLALQKDIGKRIPVGGLSDYLASVEGTQDAPIDVDSTKKTPAVARTGRPRSSRSLDSKSSGRNKAARSARGASVDSAASSKNISDEEDDEDDTLTRRKSASFKEGTLNNEGKTASTKKNAREKKKESYANKAKLPPKKEWAHSCIVTFNLRVGAVKSTCGEVYKRVGDAYAILQKYDPMLAIQDNENPKAEPIRSLGEWPVVGQHGRWQRFFTLDNELDWSWDNNIKADKPRTFVGSFTILSDNDPEEMFRYCRVDLRTTVNGVFEIKHLQELHTTISFCILGVHANVDGPTVVNDLRKHLIKAEKEIFEEINEWRKGDGFFDSRFDDFEDRWEHQFFPALSSWRGFPKGGPFEETKRGVDTSWKLAIHVSYATADHERVLAAVNEFKRNKGVLHLFGEEALLEEVILDYRDVGGRDEFQKQVPRHQNINRSVGSAILKGFVDIDATVCMYFEPPREGKVRIPKEMSIREVLRKIYVKIGGRKYSVFTYCFKNFRGQYQIWFWEKFPDMREFTNATLRVLPATIWHTLRRWGWDEGCCRRLFNASFDSETAAAAMSSKFNPTTQKVVQVDMSTQSAAHSAFGQSPFILEPGEEMKTPMVTKKVQVKRSQLGPDDIGGYHLDDLHSVGGQSNAKTVAGYGEGEDDGVSEYGDYEDYDDDDEENADGKSEGESTKYGDEDAGEDDDFEGEEEDAKMPGVLEDDSAYDTKADGASTRTGDTSKYYKGEIAKMAEENAAEIARINEENAANMRAMVQQMEAMREAFLTQMAVNVNTPPPPPQPPIVQGPEAAAGGHSGSSGSQNGPHGSAPADHE